MNGCGSWRLLDVTRFLFFSQRTVAAAFAISCLYYYCALETLMPINLTSKCSSLLLHNFLHFLFFFYFHFSHFELSFKRFLFYYWKISFNLWIASMWQHQLISNIVFILLDWKKMDIWLLLDVVCYFVLESLWNELKLVKIRQTLLCWWLINFWRDWKEFINLIKRKI